MNLRSLAALAVAPLVVAGCRGSISSESPVAQYIVSPDQPKYFPEGESDFFPDHRQMRPIIEGTVARGELREDDAYFRGQGADGKFLYRMPLKPSEKLARRGQERFNIYCSPCHDRSGHGNGTVVQRGFYKPVDLSSDRVLQMPDGEIFNVITHGVRNMPSYAAQVPVEDRWAIVMWVRVLGRSQHATVADVPPEMRDKIEPEASK